MHTKSDSDLARHDHRRAWLRPAVALVMGLASPVAWATTRYYLFVDVPATLNGTEATSGQIIRSDDGVYTVKLDLGEGMALEILPNLQWMVVPEAPADLGGGMFAESRDIMRVDGESLSLLFDGSAAGIPDASRIDALFMDDNGDLVVSFDVPTILAGTEYSASDLVRFSSFVPSLYWDAEVAGVPPEANLVGADLSETSQLVLAFDVPVSLGGTEYLPGTLIYWSSAGFSICFADPAWPAYGKLRDFSYVPPRGPGEPFRSVPGSVKRAPR